MLKANTGSSVNDEPRTAGREAASKAKKGLDRVSLVFVYASSDYDLEALVAGIREILPGIPLIGHTSYRGVVLPEGLIGGRHFVGLLALADDRLTVGVAGLRNNCCDDDPVAVGRAAAEAAMKKAGRTTPPDYFHLATSACFEELYLKGVAEVIGRRPVFGSGAVDNLVMGDWQVMTEEGPLGDGLAVAFFYADKPLAGHFTSAPYYELPERCLITRMAGPRKLLEVEGHPMLHRIARCSGCDPEFLAGADLQVATSLNPFGVKDRLGDLTALRFPMYLNPDGSIDVASSLAEGTAIIHMRAELDDLVASGGAELESLALRMENPPAAYHLSMGFGRAMVMRDEGRLEEATRLIRRAAAGVPFIMTFSLSEFGFVADGLNTCGNLMLSLAGFPQ